MLSGFLSGDFLVCSPRVLAALLRGIQYTMA